MTIKNNIKIIIRYRSGNSIYTILPIDEPNKMVVFKIDTTLKSIRGLSKYGCLYNNRRTALGRPLPNVIQYPIIDEIFG